MFDILNKKVVCVVTRIFLSPDHSPVSSHSVHHIPTTALDGGRHLRRQNTPTKLAPLPGTTCNFYFKYQIKSSFKVSTN